MNGRQLIESKIPSCIGGDHIWRRVKLFGCRDCKWHKGFACDLCDSCVDGEQDYLLYEAIESLLPEEKNDGN